jgi:hypothetical protein
MLRPYRESQGGRFLPMVRKYRSLARVSDLTVKTMPTMVRNTPSIPSATPDEIPLRECIGCGCYRETLKVIGSNHFDPEVV